jgi:N-acyl-phosphatidylethanolamine-hydrolysing phospholipase D
MNILIDPMFENRVVSVVGEKRAIDLPCKIKDLPEIHVVLLSHDHYDHWNTGSLK